MHGDQDVTLASMHAAQWALQWVSTFMSPNDLDAHYDGSRVPQRGPMRRLWVLYPTAARREGIRCR